MTHDIVNASVSILSERVAALDSMDLAPAKHKMTIACSSTQIGKQVVRLVRHLGYRYASALEVLGIEVAAGRRLTYTRLRPRIARTRTRMPRLGCRSLTNQERRWHDSRDKRYLLRCSAAL
eukprot:7354353-Pyramimonas_sp.AAC.1